MRRIYLIALVLALACVLPAGALGQCPILTKNLDKDQPVPVINVPVDSDTFIHGKIPQVAGAVPNGKVQVCVDANAAGGPVTLSLDGSFVADPGGALHAGQAITAQFISAAAGNPLSFSTDVVKVAPPSCAKALKPAADSPGNTVYLNVDSSGNVTGSVPSYTGGSVDICNKDAKILSVAPDKSGKFSGAKLTIKSGDTIVAYYAPTAVAPTVYTNSSPAAKVTAALQVGHGPFPRCAGMYTDCHWTYSVIGGIEQSDLSSQSSQTNGFADFLVRAPATSPVYGWGQVRFLGAPNTSNTSNIVAAVSDPSGNLSSSTLSSVGFAIDYVGGVEYDPKWARPGNGKYTIGIVAGVGATTPLSSQSPTVGYAVPAYGTNECTELLVRLSAAYGYSTPLPGSNTITTTTAMTSGGTTTTTTSISPTYCSVNPIATTTIAKNTVTGVVTTTTTSGTQVTNIAYAPEDRSNFLLKYYGGIRLIDRILFDKSNQQCFSTETAPGVDNCTRAFTDIIFGQDESITGGVLHRVVFRLNVTYPIRAGVFFYGSASLRATPNVNLDPIILTPTPVTGGAAAATPGAVTIPSPNVYVFPLRQSDRDFYRIGIALDLTTILPKLFSATSK